MFAVIGDVHGKHEKYKALCESFEVPTIQVGDMGYDYSKIMYMPSKDKFIGGNHEDWNNIHNCPNYLGRYGVTEIDGKSIFYISGAFSIDMKLRQIHHANGGPQTWFPNEELDMEEKEKCYDLYKQVKPDIVISHDCPKSIVDDMKGSSNVLVMLKFNLPVNYVSSTQEFLERLHLTHQPSKWIFGHHHESWMRMSKGTMFTCLDELNYMEIYS